MPLFPQCGDYKHVPPCTILGSARGGAQSFGYLVQQTVRASAEETTGPKVAEEQIFIYFIFILFLVFLLFGFSETGFLCIALAILELTL